MAIIAASRYHGLLYTNPFGRGLPSSTFTSISWCSTRSTRRCLRPSKPGSFTAPLLKASFTPSASTHTARSSSHTNANFPSFVLTATVYSAGAITSSATSHSRTTLPVTASRSRPPL